MAQIRTPAEASDPASSRPHEESPSQASSGGPGHKQHVSPFWRHFLEMLAAMVVGMLVTGAIFLSIVGLKTWDEVTLQYPTQALLAMAAGMTIPMMAWMLFRGMGRRNTYEMAAAMILPVVPFLCLVWFDVTQSACAGLLRDDDRGHVGADELPPEQLLDGNVAGVRTINRLARHERVYRTRRLPNVCIYLSRATPNQIQQARYSKPAMRSSI